MTTRTHLAVWAGSALLATGALVGCGPGDQQEPGTPPQTEQTAPDAASDDSDNMAMYEPEDTGNEPGTADDPAMTDDPSTAADQSYASPEGEQAGSLEGMMDDEIVGKAIVSRDGEEIGNVDEVVVDGTTGQKFAVVDVGGFLGVGEKSIVVALDELQAADQDRIQSDLTRETLQTQTEYDPTYFKKSEEEESSTY